MDNLLKQLRHQLNLTQAELAKETGMSSAAIMKYEQGLYENPSPKLLSYLASQSETSVEKILLSYNEFQEHTRRYASRYLAHAYLAQTELLRLRTNNRHPFQTWRSDLLNSSSRMKFCKLLAINPAVVLAYERGDSPKMPPMIRNALYTAGTPDTTVDALTRLGAEYHDFLQSED